MVELAQQLDAELQTEDVTGWMAVDSNDMGYELLSDAAIIYQVTRMVEDEDEPEETSEEERATPTPAEVKVMLDKCMLWYERQKECCTPSCLLMLKNLCDMAAMKRYTNLKQLELTSFFKH